jgi:hypothetical protein
MSQNSDFDPVNLLMCCIGALIFYELWKHDILTAEMIWKILSAEI